MVPSPLDRRLAVRRIVASRTHQPERRVAGDRRVDMRRSRLYFPPDESAWLCFESSETRVRLRPVPEGWMTWPEAELEALLAQAQPHVPAHRPR